MIQWRKQYHRQGKSWSQYRCRCFAIDVVQCICSKQALKAPSKRLYWANLNKTSLYPLFNKYSIERIYTPLDNISYRSLNFGGKHG